MQQPSLKPIYEHLEWSREELAAAGEQVEEMMKSPAWAALTRSLEDRLRFEQMVLMRSPTREEEASYERLIGRWDGMRRAEALAEGIVTAGREAAEQMAA